MKLPISQLFAKKEATIYLLGILLYDERLKVIIFNQNESSLQIVTHHEELLPATLDECSHEQLIESFDKAIGIAENKLPENADLRKTIFGVKQDWVEEEKIKKDYLIKLKKISEELDLEPIGFIVFTESLSHLISQKQDAPLSGILVEVEKETLTLSILRAGKIIESKTDTIKQSEAVTVDNLLQQITDIEILPSKLLISETFRKKNLKKQFEDHEWSKTLPFLHEPQIQILPSGFDLQAIAVGTATQLGLVLNEVELVPENLSNHTPVVDEQNHISSEQEDGEFKTPEAFGFVHNKDIDSVPTKTYTIEEISNDQNGSLSSENRPPLAILLRHLPTKKEVMEFMEQLRDKLPTITGKSTMIIVPAVVLLLITIIVMYMLTVKANISIALTPKPISEEKQIIISPKQDTNFTKNILHGSVVQVSEDGSASTTPTGKKDVGEKAKGTVTLFNNDSTSHTISVGTTITSETNITFTLDSTVTVASQSGDAFTEKVPGKTDVAVTATVLGPDGNLPSGTKFTISGISTVAAKNTNAFSGGSKKTVTVVSDQDLAKLLSDLPNQLEQKGKEDLSHQTTGGTSILPNITNTTISKKTFSKKSGDEATSVMLTGTVSFQSISYDKNDITGYAQYILKDKVTDKNKLSKDSVKVDINAVTLDKKQNAQATASIQAATIPILDSSVIIASIKGKSFSSAQSILQQIPQFQSADMSLSPSIFFLPKTFPGSEKKITVIIRTQ